MKNLRCLVARPLLAHFINYPRSILNYIIRKKNLTGHSKPVGRHWWLDNGRAYPCVLGSSRRTTYSGHELVDSVK